MQRSSSFIFLAVVLVVGSSSWGMTGESSGFERILTHYEAIRLALLNDSTDNVAVVAGHIQHELHALQNDFTEETAGIQPGRGEELRAVLPSIQTTTASLIEAATIADARQAFGALSKAMVQYRQLVSEPAPIVAYCSMAKEVWLQPKGEIGNPYYGQSMAGCGEIVSE